MNILAASTWEIIFGVVLFFISLAMILIVLIQKEKGGGLSGAFGGSGSISTFGVKTSQVVERVTWFLFILFVIGTFTMAGISAKTNTKASKTEAPVAATTATKTDEAADKDKKPETTEKPEAPKDNKEAPKEDSKK